MSWCRGERYKALTTTLVSKVASDVWQQRHMDALFAACIHHSPNTCVHIASFKRFDWVKVGTLWKSFWLHVHYRKSFGVWWRDMWPPWYAAPRRTRAWRRRTSRWVLPVRERWGRHCGESTSMKGRKSSSGFKEKLCSWTSRWTHSGHTVDMCFISINVHVNRHSAYCTSTQSACVPLTCPPHTWRAPTFLTSWSFGEFLCFD